MRPDVKLGVIAAAVIVFVTGGYYLARDRAESPIPVASGPGALADSGTAPSTPASMEGAAGKSVKPLPAGGNRTVEKPSDGAQRTTGARRMPTNLRPPGGDALTAERKKPEIKPPAQLSDSMASESASTSPGGGETQSTLDGAVPSRMADKVGHPASSSNTAPDESLASTTEASRLADAAGAGVKSDPTHSPAVPGSDASPLNSVPLTALGRPDSTTREAAGGARGAVESHRVQPGDTLVSLAKQYYGDAKFLSLLQAANPTIQSPGSLVIGSQVKIPPRPQDEAALTVKSATPGAEGIIGARGTTAGSAKTPIDSTTTTRTYRVKSGDSFYKIARDVLGNSARWQELYELNKDRVKGDAKSLQVGQEILLPPSER